MVGIERKLGGIITVRRETSAERLVLLNQSSQSTQEAARAYMETPTRENSARHIEAYDRHSELLNRPLAAKVRLLDLIPLPGASVFLPTQHFSAADLSH